MTKEYAQSLIDKKDFSNYSFEYLDGYVDGINSLEKKKKENKVISTKQLKYYWKARKK